MDGVPLQWQGWDTNAPPDTLTLRMDVLMYYVHVTGRGLGL